MASRVLFRPDAEAEVIEADAWHAARQPELRERFVSELVDTMSRVVERPLAFPRIHGETRRAVLRRFPYAVYFRDLDDSIVVLAVHGRQYPKRWRARR